MSRFAERSHKSKKKKPQYNSSYCELGPPVHGVIYRGDKARVEEEKEVCFTIYQFEILLYELLELLFE